MRSTVTLLAVMVLCLPTIAAEAQPLPSRSAATAASETPGTMGGNYPQLAHGEGWGYPGMGWGGQGMGWGPPESMGCGEQGMGWGGQGMSLRHPRMGWGPQGPMGAGMGHFDMMIPMMMALADTNSDGAVSLEEIQAVHSRMFNFMDANKDGKLTPQEVQNAFQGGSAGSTGQSTSPSQPGTGNQ